MAENRNLKSRSQSSAAKRIMECLNVMEHNGHKVVSARDLHRALGSKRQFGDWIKERIRQYQLVENQDYEVFHGIVKNPTGGRPAKEYALPIGTAKELCMVEGNEAGRNIRRYFIEMEQQALDMLRNQIDEVQRKARLQMQATGQTESITMLLDGQVVTTSLILAKLQGREHQDVCASIQRVFCKVRDPRGMFIAGTYKVRKKRTGGNYFYQNCMMYYVTLAGIKQMFRHGRTLTREHMQVLFDAFSKSSKPTITAADMPKLVKESMAADSKREQTAKGLCEIITGLYGLVMAAREAATAAGITDTRSLQEWLERLMREMDR